MKLAKPTLDTPPPDPLRPAVVQCAGAEFTALCEREQRGEFHIWDVAVSGARYTASLAYPWQPGRRPRSPWVGKKDLQKTTK